MRLSIISLLVLMLVLSACSGDRAAMATPESPIPGYYASGQVVQGGEKVEELNLRDVSAGVSGSETIVSLSFVTGSAAAGGEEKPLNKTPAFSVESLDGPGRLMVTLALSYSDYVGREPEAVGLFTAMHALPEPGDQGGTRLYFQFLGKVGFKVEEQKGALILRVEPENPEEEPRNYAYVAYDAAVRDIALDSGMHPVLCEDGENMLFLSPPYRDYDGADELKSALNTRLEQAGSNLRAGVFAMSGNAAPSYQANITLEEILHMGALATPDGQVHTAGLWAEDARFLAWTPDGKALCAYPTLGEENGEQVMYEQLWVYDTQGNRAPFIENEYASISSSAFSRDGRYLAFIESVEAKRLLYVYDTQGGEKKLDFLSSEGMGDFTASFDWSQDGKLYALSGTETMQLMCFDPDKTGTDQPRVTGVEERYGGAGTVACAGGMVYISGDDAGKIYQVDPATGTRSEFAEGDGFFISPDGATMVITYYEYELGVDSQTGVKVRDMATGEETPLIGGYTYHGGSWSNDGAMLGFVVSNFEAYEAYEDQEDVAGTADSVSSGSDDYPARLYIYHPGDPGAELAGMLASDSVFPGRNAHEVVLVAYYQREDGTLMPLTYRLELP